jgi:hypothetical protein
MQAINKKAIGSLQINISADAALDNFVCRL